MSKPVTIEDIYQLFQASNQSIQASNEAFDRRIAQLDRLFVKSKAEDDRRKARDDQRKAEADIRKAEADRSMAELQKTVDRTSKSVDALTTRWGRFVEELVMPAVLQLFQAKGIDVKEVYPRAQTSGNVLKDLERKQEALSDFN